MASKATVFGAGACIEWQERQFTAAELAWIPVESELTAGDLAWKPVESEVCSVAWQARQSCAPERPFIVEIRVGSPPDSMCAVPSPWQVAQTSLGSGFLSLCE